MAEATARGWPRWIMVLAIVATLIAVAFVGYALVITARIARADDAGRVRDLAIAAKNISEWPIAAREIGKANLYHKGDGGHKAIPDAAVQRIWLHHPELGDFQVDYSRPEKEDKCPDDVKIRDNLLNVSGTALDRVPNVEDSNGNEKKYISYAHTASWYELDTKRPICFSVGKLRLKDVTQVPHGFKHLLLVKVADTVAPKPGVAPAAASTGPAGPAIPDNTIVAHISDVELPIRSLDDLPQLRPQLEAVTQTLVQLTGGAVKLVDKPASDARADRLEPITSSVVGSRYRFYFYPVSLAGGGNYLLVGTVDEAAPAVSFGQLGPRALYFALALALLLALTPTIKLALLGSVDGIKPIEVTALVYGMLGAAAIATAIATATWDMQHGRATALARLKSEAATLRDATSDEILRLLTNPSGSAIDALSVAMATASQQPAEKPIMIVKVEAPAGEVPGKQRDIVQPDSLFPIDRNGRPVEGLPLTTMRDMSGSGYDLHDRPYFLRAVAGDFAHGSKAIVDAIKASSGMTGAWKECATGGLVFEQVRSRPDGVAKTVAATQGSPNCLPRSLPAIEDPDEDRDRLRVLGVSMILKSLLSPSLPANTHFAVLDAGRGVDGLPVLFHSRRGRANIELFAEGLDAAARAGVAKAAATRPACVVPRAKKATVDPETFIGSYEGTPSLFAVTRLPCTDWVVLTFIARDAVDKQATRAIGHAMSFWVGGLLILGIVWFIVHAVYRARHDKPSWLWLWPDPRKHDRYPLAVKALAAVGGVTLILALSPWSAVAALFGPAAALTSLWFIVRKDAEPDAAGGRVPLTTAMERDVMLIVALLVTTMAVLPMVGLTRDATGYFAAQQEGRDVTAKLEAGHQQARDVEAIALTFSKALRHAPGVFPAAIGAAATSGTIDKPEPKWSFTGLLRRETLDYDRNENYAEPAPAPEPRPTVPAPVLAGWFALVGLLGVIAAAAFRSALRGLFGFGVVLEAVPYPGLPLEGDGNTPPDTRIAYRELPDLFITVATPSNVRRELDACAEVTIDLFEATAENAVAEDAPAAGAMAPTPLLLVTNLEMLVRNQPRRLDALELLEGHVARRRGRDGKVRYKIGLLSDLSPLDRLLQSYERDADDIERLAEDDRHRLRAELASHREDVRWSRLFENFSTFIHGATPRSRTDEGDIADEEKEAVRIVAEEVAYLPDHVVAATIPDTTPERLEPREIAKWAKGFKTSSPRAIVDYLSSMLIEHYQLSWSISSHAERLILHHFAHGQVVNIGQADALRSLVRRGLVVLDPVPRVMNRSFAQFVRRAENPKTLARWRDREAKSPWQLFSGPLTIALPFAFGVFAIVAIRSGASLTSILPLVVSVGPALVNLFGGGRRTPA